MTIVSIVHCALYCVPPLVNWRSVGPSVNPQALLPVPIEQVSAEMIGVVSRAVVPVEKLKVSALLSANPVCVNKVPEPEVVAVTLTVPENVESASN